MSREAETMQTLKNIGDVSKTEAILADIALSLAQIADRLNPVVTVNDKTIIHTYDSTKEFIGGRGGE